MPAAETPRIFNFSSGPAMLPLPVLKQAQAEMLSLPGVGMSVLEISHRSAEFEAILASARNRIQQLLDVPANYKILFLQGGSRLQFSMVPMNLLRGQPAAADYIVHGSWSKYAVEEARREGPVNVAWDGKATNYDRLPAAGEVKLTPGAAYAHITSNETIQGVEYPQEPEVGGAPLIADLSSNFLSRPVPVQKYGMIYACAQKNAGPAGVTVVIIRDDLLTRSPDNLPGYLNYQKHAAENSMWNTPPCFGIYIVDLVAKWLQDDIGGLGKMLEINRRKAGKLYRVVDDLPNFYKGHAQSNCRSLMNVTFRLGSEELEKKFLKGSEQRGLSGLKGHRSVGGMRASIYNAMPEAGVELLEKYMREFAAENS